MNVTLITVFSALLGGGGIAALIQVFLLPRTMAKSRADTTQVIVGAAGEAVKMLETQLKSSNDRVKELEIKVREQETEIGRLETMVRHLERRVTEATQRQDEIEES